MAERYVREGEARVAQQKLILARMERAGYQSSAQQAKDVLVTLMTTLDQWRETLDAVRRRHEPPVGNCLGRGQLG